MKNRRVSVTLPEELYDYYLERSRLTGLSISRLIYQSLRTRKPIMIADDGFLAAVQEVRQLLEDLKISGKVDADAVDVFRRQCNIWERVLDFDHVFETITARKSHTKRKESVLQDTGKDTGIKKTQVRIGSASVAPLDTGKDTGIKKTQVIIDPPRVHPQTHWRVVPVEKS